MADLAVVAASVLPGPGARKRTVIFGETLTQGMAVYRKVEDGRWYKADNDQQASAAAQGITLDAGSAGQEGRIQIGGDIKLGVQPGLGTVYVVSGNGGGIAPASDLGAGKYTTVLGVGKAGNTLGMGVSTNISNTAA